jgi:hypothetical protein
MKTNMKIYLVRFYLLGMFIAGIDCIQAQEAVEPPHTKKTSPWSGYFDIGLNAFVSKGIPMSRNEINYYAASPGGHLNYKQESRTLGYGYELGVKYRISPKMKVGIMLNIFKDADEYQYLYYEPQNAGSIEGIVSDTVPELSIRNYQSYANLGLSLDYLAHQSPSGRHQLIGAIATGLSINRTPDRTEYDLFADGHFLQWDNASDKDWRFTHTEFRNGFFLSPSITYSRRIKNDHLFRITVTELLQWNSTQPKYKILDSNSDGTGTVTPYTVRAFQLKFGYSF